MGWAIGSEGRKHHVGPAIVSEGGEALPVARGTWIELRQGGLQQRGCSVAGNETTLNAYEVNGLHLRFQELDEFRATPPLQKAYGGGVAQLVQPEA